MCWPFEGGAGSGFLRVIKNLLLIERVQDRSSCLQAGASQRCKSANIQILQPPNRRQSATSAFFHTHFLLEYEADVVFVLKPSLFSSSIIYVSRRRVTVNGVPCHRGFFKINQFVYSDL